MKMFCSSLHETKKILNKNKKILEVRQEQIQKTEIILLH